MPSDLLSVSCSEAGKAKKPPPKNPPTAKAHEARAAGSKVVVATGTAVAAGVAVVQRVTAEAAKAEDGPAGTMPPATDLQTPGGSHLWTYFALPETVRSMVR